ncbi:MAG: hypothetical protein HY070_00420, partial [Chloroflexi bacterium]|nr:hypothetical protein [Chloroflexota bacterium]
MKSKINLFTRFAALAALTLFFFASTRSVAANSFVPPSAAEIIPWPARAIDPIDFQRLLDQAQKKGSVRVIVGLR